MKNTRRISFLLFVFLFAYVTTTKSQAFYQFGYNAGFPTGLKNLNYIIDRYNETRPELSRQMGHISYLDGTTGSFGWVMANNGVFLEFGWSAGGQKTYSVMTDAANHPIRRDLYVKERMFDLSCGLNTDMNDDVSHLFVGASLSAGALDIKTRSGLESKIKKVDWTNINENEHIKFTIGVFVRYQYKNPGFYIQPYFNFLPKFLFQNDLTETNEYLNPNTFQNDPSPLNVQYNTFGIKIGFAFLSNEF